MDEYNHIMDPEYANIVYQTQVSSNPAENENQHSTNNQSTPPENSLQELLPSLEPQSQVQPVAYPSDASGALPDTESTTNAINEFSESAATGTIAEEQRPAESPAEGEKVNSTTNNEDDAESSVIHENETAATESEKLSTVAEAESDAPPKPNEDTNDDHDEASSLIVPEANAKKEEEEIDLNQCRVCMATENLVDIFRIDQKSLFRLSDLIMKLCTSIKISERDHLPHMVCAVCVDRIEAAYELKLQCEETEKILRSKLKRSKRTRRGPSEFVVIDCAPEPSSESDDENIDDDEFHLSEVTEASEADSDMSYESTKKRTQSRRSRKKPPPKQAPKRKNLAAQQVYHAVKQPRKGGIVYIKAVDSDDDVPLSQRQTKKPPKTQSKRTSDGFEYTCDTCAKVCGTAEALIQHQRLHVDEKCPICSKAFKQRSTLLQHIQKHKDDEERICGQCHKVFASKMECRRHMQTAHTESFACSRCKRDFPSKIRLDKHKCEPVNSSSKRRPDTEVTSNSGRDLFKSVAPLTTTYWSDSFSD